MSESKKSTDRCKDESRESSEDDPSILSNQLPHPSQRPPNGDGLREEFDFNLLLRQVPPATARKQRTNAEHQFTKLPEQINIFSIIS